MITPIEIKLNQLQHLLHNDFNKVKKKFNVTNIIATKLISTNNTDLIVYKTNDIITIFDKAIAIYIKEDTKFNTAIKLIARNVIIKEFKK